MRIQAHIPKNEYGFLKRAEDGTWLVETNLASTPVIEPPKGLSALGRNCYRLIGLETGEARVIRFSDLHRHSDNSLRDAILKIKDMVAGTEYSGALTDHGNIYGFLEYYKAMKKAGKKPIIGTEAYMENMNGNLAGNHVVLLAKNAQGYQNLRKLSSESFAPENFHSNPHITWAMLERYHEGIICLSACLKGIIPECLKNGNIETAKAAIEQFKGLFDEDFYIEIQNHGISEEDRVRPQLVALAKEYGVKIVATTDTHYLTAEDREAHQVVLCLRTESTMDAPKMSYDGSGYFLHNSEDMEERFADYPEALDNTLEIEEKCNFEIELNQVNLPNYEIPAGFSSPFDYMCHIADKGFKTRFEGTDHFTDPAYLDRLQYEKDMIKQMGFASYFVIIWDVINYCRQHNSYIGPGRGSAAGSMVAYCMGLTDLDPIRYGLLFERFLNPERVSWPDIDTDVEYSFRPHAIEYMRKKYGQDNVCRIATFGTMAARQSIKDVTRVLGLPASLGNELSQMVPAVTKITLDKATELGTPLAARMAQDPVVERIVKLAKRIEGCRRQISVHACGVCVSPSMVSDYIPTCLAIDKETGQKVLCTQVTKDEVEELSLIKMDLLGLRNLGVMHETLDRVQTNYGKDTILKALNSMKDKVDYHDIPLNDRATYELLSKGRPVGAFQLDQPEMSRLIKNILWDLDTINKKAIEGLAYSGALNCFSPNKAALLRQYELIVENYKAVAPLLAMGQTSMLGMDTAHVDMPNVPNLPPNVTLAKEVEVLGLYVSNHPADRYAPRLKNRPDYTSLEDVVDMNSEVGQVKTMGMIAEWRPFTTRNNETMAAFSLETKFAALPCLVFSKQFQELSPYMADGRVLCIEGGLTRDKKEEDKFVLIARKVYRPEEVLTSAEETIVAVVHNAAEQREILNFIQAHPGNTPVTLRAYNRFFPLQSKVDNSPLAKVFFSRFSEKSQTRSYK